MSTVADSNTWREKIRCFIESSKFQNFIITLIIINAISLGLETNADIMKAWGAAIHALDSTILLIFVIEILLRLYVLRTAFFRDPWCLFDFIVVSIALVPASGPFEVLRALRVLRVLRLLTMVPSMRKVVAGMIASLPGLGSIGVMMSIVFYVAAVIATNLFGERFPEWFGSLGNSAYTLFQVMTLESWSMGIVRPVMEVYPYAWTFFLPFILIATFTMLNLLMAVIVNAVQEVQHDELEQSNQVMTERLDTESQSVQQEFDKLHKELAEIKSIMQKKAQ